MDLDNMPFFCPESAWEKLGDGCRPFFRGSMRFSIPQHFSVARIRTYSAIVSFPVRSSL